MQRGAARVVAVDLLAIDPVPGAVMLQGDFTEPAVQQRCWRNSAARPIWCCPTWRRTPPGTPPPTICASWRWPRRRWTFAIEVLAEGGGFVAKVFQGGAEKAMLDRLKRRFATVRHAKPPASRKESSELYVVATGFRAHSSVSANPSRSSARSTLIRTA